MTRPKDPKRAAAIERGDLTYVGNPCYKGHSGKRYVAGGHCWECQKVKLLSSRQSPKWKAYQKKYRAAYGKDPKNKERLYDIRMRWYIKKHYNNDEALYLRVQEEKAERRAERKAHDAEVAMRRSLRQQRNKDK